MNIAPPPKSTSLLRRCDTCVNAIDLLVKIKRKGELQGTASLLKLPSSHILTKILPCNQYNNTCFLIAFNLHKTKTILYTLVHMLRGPLATHILAENGIPMTQLPFSMLRVYKICPCVTPHVIYPWF